MSAPGGQGHRGWVKELVDKCWPYQIVQSMNDLVDRAEFAESEVERLRSALHLMAQMQFPEERDRFLDRILESSSGPAPNEDRG